jgi:threonine synthase
MGLPISRLVLASNENDILARFFHSGIYARGNVVKTLSPSMDIQVASNFERYLYYRLGEDPAILRRHMEGFDRDQLLTVEPASDGRIDPVVVAGVGNRATTLETILRYRQDHDYLLDPHTAVGIHVAEQHLAVDEPMICLSTAHPAKFSAAITEAIGEEAHHPVLDGLIDLPVRCHTVPNHAEAVRAFIATHA